MNKNRDIKNEIYTRREEINRCISVKNGLRPVPAPRIRFPPKPIPAPRTRAGTPALAPRNMDKYIFYAETIEGYSFKNLIEIIEKRFENSFFNKSVSLKVNKNGIFIYMFDDDVLIDSTFYAKFMKKFIFSPNFDEFLFGLPSSFLLKKIKK